MKKVLVTGCAGFIGYHITRALLDRSDIVVGIDNLNEYYDVNLKKSRLQQLHFHPNNQNFKFHKIDLQENQPVQDLFCDEKFDCVIHLAAQAGVRYSITNPHAYVGCNLVAFINILEACRHNKINHLVYASSSSVYGGNTKIPFEETDIVDNPVSLYAATKKSNELMAHTYSHLYKIPTTGLRFFTVYGPWGRPDMSPFLFIESILNNRPINVFNFGDMMRDFTYIDDVVTGTIKVLDKPATPSSNNDNLSISANAPYRIFNIGNSSPEKLMDFIHSLESAIGKKALINFMPMQDGDVKTTYANTSCLESWTGFKPITPLFEGVRRFVDWYKTYNLM